MILKTTRLKGVGSDAAAAPATAVGVAVGVAAAAALSYVTAAASAVILPHVGQPRTGRSSSIT